jgi:alpha-N-arabinofuranosidase
MEELIQRHAAIMNQYDPQQRVAMVVDEWGAWHDVEPGTNQRFLYQQNTLRDALVAGVTLNIFNNHCDRVRMANLAQTVNVLQALILTDGPRMLTTPTYHVFDLYKDHQDAMLLPTHLESGDYELDGQRIPQLSVSASRDASSHVLLTLCNVDPRHESEVVCDFRGGRVRDVEGATLLAAARMQAHNSFSHPDALVPVTFPDIGCEQDSIAFVLPPMSLLAVHILVV